MAAEDLPPREQGSRTIQLPYHNRFETIWEYEEAYLSGQIDFSSSIGDRCPICRNLQCYRKITPYRRYVIELFPEFEKEWISIARFICRKHRKTFSLLPFQLIPYFQYTVGAVIGALLLGMECWQRRRRGFYGASRAVDSESLVTPWLISCWLGVMLRGLRRGHAALRRFYTLDGIRTPNRDGTWEEAAGYFEVFGLKPKIRWYPPLMELVDRYSRGTRQFFFGTASQHRHSVCQ